MLRRHRLHQVIVAALVFVFWFFCSSSSSSCIPRGCACRSSHKHLFGKNKFNLKESGLLTQNMSVALQPLLPHQVRHVGRQEEAGHPAGQRGAAPAPQRPDPAWRNHPECHRAVPDHRPATQTGSPGLVRVPSCPSPTE